MADLESQALSGELFREPQRSSSPVRTDSDNDSFDDSRSDERISFAPNPDGGDFRAQPQREQHSIGLGDGRTGVKGVLRDRAEAVEREKAQRRLEADALWSRMERSAITVPYEQEREALDGHGSVDELAESVLGRRRVDAQGRGKARFGHLREVGAEGFVRAVEREGRGVSVVVHLYDPYLDRCYELDETLGRLARAHPGTKFVRARASALGFASTKVSKRVSSFRRPPRREANDDGDDEDPYGTTPDGAGEEEEEEEDSGKDQEDVEVDTDVLPTLLVYRDGQLVHNWVRVDWEAGRATIDEFLLKHHIISSPFMNEPDDVDFEDGELG